VRIIIKCPESNSPLRGRIHLRGLSHRPTSNLLQSGGGPYIFASCAAQGSARYHRRYSDWQLRLNGLCKGDG
jgi:hypothetical protein